MALTLKPFKELVAMSMEKLDEALLPLRIRGAKAKADGEVIKLEEVLLKLEADISTACAQKELNIHHVLELMDSYDLTERKLKQIQKLVTELFPAS